MPLVRPEVDRLLIDERVVEAIELLLDRPFMIAETNVEGFVRLPNELLKPLGSKHFLLRVKGNSMNLAEIDGQRIEDGDLVLVRPQPTVNNGDVVVALIDGEATIKQFSKAPGYLVLKPRSSDPKHLPIVVHKQLTSQGVVRHVFLGAPLRK